MLDETTFQVLTSLARQKQASIGKLIRHALDKTYLKPQVVKATKAQQSYSDLLTWQKQLNTTKQIDYRQLIEYGRHR